MAVQARRYLDGFGMVQWWQAVFQTLVNDQPANPWDIIIEAADRARKEQKVAEPPAAAEAPEAPAAQEAPILAEPPAMEAPEAPAAEEAPILAEAPAVAEEPAAQGATAQDELKQKARAALEAALAEAPGTLAGSPHALPLVRPTRAEG